MRTFHFDNGYIGYVVYWSIPGNVIWEVYDAADEFVAGGDAASISEAESYITEAAKG